MIQAIAVCECVLCCGGEHAGECTNCAGWGEVAGEHCEKCDGQGLCSVCRGTAGKFKCLDCRDRGGPMGTVCSACGFSEHG